MYNTAKNSFISFTVIFILSFILWYTNKGNDRIYAVFFIFCSLIQLIQYAIFSNGNTIQGTIIVFYLMIFQVLLFSVAIYMSYKNTIYSDILKVYVILTFIYCLFCACYIQDKELNCKILNGTIQYYINNRITYLFFWLTPIIISAIILFFINIQLNYDIIVIATIVVFVSLLIGYSIYYHYYNNQGNIFDMTYIILLIIFILGSL